MQSGFYWVSTLLVWGLLLLTTLTGAQTPEGNLVVNPGFEEPVSDGGHVGWVFVSHGQDFIRGQVQAVDYHTGLQAASVVVSEQPRVYACWAQHVAVKEEALLPDEVSVWYRAPDADAQLVMTFTGFEGDRPVAKGNWARTLPRSRDWVQHREVLDVPSGTRDILLELRVAAKGEFRFDDVALVRREPDAAPGAPDRLLIVGVERARFPALWREAFAQAGFPRLAFETWDNLAPQLLGKCRVVLLLNLPPRPELSAADEAILGLLEDYVRAGGGVLCTQNHQQCVTGMVLYFAVAERFGGRILVERTVSDPGLTRQFGPWWADQFTYTDAVRGPLVGKVRGLLYQSHVDMGSFAGVLPFLPQEPWDTILTAGPQSHSEPYLMGLEEVDRFARPEGFTSDVPLAGVRVFGAGRVAYVGMNPCALFMRAISTDDDRRTYDSYMVQEMEGRPNDLVRFYTELCRWLGEGADSVSQAALTMAPISPPAFTTEWKLHRGIIGPRTVYSCGRSTPDEYVNRAKELGLDFVIFLEDFAQLQPGGFERLKQDCRRLSDGEFLAVPGITYENTDGNHAFAFGSYLKLPSQRLLDASGKRFTVYPDGPKDSPVNTDQTWVYQLLGFENCSGWYLFSRSPYPHFDTRDVNCMGVITQQSGETVERVLEAYGQQARNEQYLWPMALTLMDNAQELSWVQDGIYYHLVVGAQGTAQLWKLFNTYDCRGAKHLFPPAPPFGFTSVTNGPVIELSLPRGDTDPQGDIFNPNLQEWALELRVTSGAGLREVVLMDGDVPIRRFLPAGAREFTYRTSLTKERQKHIWVHATDVDGKEAFSRDVHCDSWLLREWQCGDRNNQLLFSQQLREDGSTFYIGYGGDTATPDKGPWNGRIRPVGCFVFDKKLGAGAMAYDGSPEGHPQVMLTPWLVYDGQQPESVGWAHRLVAGREGAPHVQPRRVVSSSEVLVGERILDGVFPYEADPVIHVWHTLYPVKPSQHLKTTARVSLYLPKVDGVVAYLWDQEFELLADLPVREGSLYAACLGTIYGSIGRTEQSERVLFQAGKQTERTKLEGHPVAVTAFNAGDYLGILGNPFGSLFVYSLSDGLVLEGDGINFNVGVAAAPGILPRGARLRARLLLVGMHRLVEDPVALAGQVAQDWALAGGTPSYSVALESGEVLGWQYELALRAHESGVLGTIRGLSALAGNLGCTVDGLRDHWTAWLQVQDPEPKTRIIPVEEGKGYAVLRASEDARRLFIGHPVIADEPDVVISIARTVDWKSWQVEAHNPTDHPMDLRLRHHPGVRGLSLDWALHLEPGSSAFRVLPVEAPGPTP